MNFYLLDTTICIFLLNQRGGFENIIQRMDSMSRENAKRLERFLLDFEAIDFNLASAAAYGPIRSNLHAQGTPIGPMDFLIAAHALAIKATLVANNTSEFQRVPGLRLEDWSIPV